MNNDIGAILTKRYFWHFLLRGIKRVFTSCCGILAVLYTLCAVFIQKQLAVGDGVFGRAIYVLYYYTFLAVEL